MLLFTDGITESMTAAQDQFGDERLIALLEQLAPQTPAEGISNALMTAAREFASGAPASDDMTVLAVRYRGAH
ncbi:MAG: SpoIIE family protein phosphatase [Acidobacteria bacterium]|nr:SpoIIE family protein phosphatase [Acidobacteriota bacterium]